jgi:hypothetical protein
MTTVQIAIPDQAYAEVLCRLLAADGKHEVYTVDRPNAALGGVVVADESNIGLLPPGINSDALIVLAKESSDFENLWNVGVRCVLPADYPPAVARLVVLATEMRLNPSVGEAPPTCYGNHHTNGRAWEQIRDLKNALADAVQNSSGVAKALNVLHRYGREVQIEIDAVLFEDSRGDDRSAVVSTEPTYPGISMFEETDKAFLRMFRISEP